jgi:hypothetical protein
VYPEFLEDVADVSADGRQLDEEPLGDIRVVEALSHQPQDVEFTGPELSDDAAASTLRTRRGRPDRPPSDRGYAQPSNPFSTGPGGRSSRQWRKISKLDRALDEGIIQEIGAVSSALGLPPVQLELNA